MPLPSTDVSFHASLTPDELRLLDGRCSESLQAQVDTVRLADQVAARQELPFSHALFVARTIEAALKDKRVSVENTPMVHCPVTGRRAGRVRPRRATRDNPFKSEVDVPFAGIGINRGFVITINHPRIGCSVEAFEALRPALAAELGGLRVELSERITGHPPRYVRENVLACKTCGWNGRRIETCSRNSYHVQCPGCQRQGSSHEGTSMFRTTDETMVIDAEQIHAEEEALDRDRCPWRYRSAPSLPTAPRTTQDWTPPTPPGP